MLNHNYEPGRCAGCGTTVMLRDGLCYDCTPEEMRREPMTSCDGCGAVPQRRPGGVTTTEHSPSCPKVPGNEA